MQVQQITVLFLILMMAMCCHSQSNELFNSGDRSKCNSKFQYNDLADAYNLLLRVRSGSVRARAWLEKALRSRITNLAKVLRSEILKRPKLTLAPPPLVNPYNYSYIQPWAQINITAQSAQVPTTVPKATTEPVTEPITFTTSSPDGSLESASSVISKSRSLPSNSFFELKPFLQPPAVSIAKTDFEMNNPPVSPNSVKQVDPEQPSELGATNQNKFAEPPSNFVPIRSSSSKDSVKTFPGKFESVGNHYYRNGHSIGYTPVNGRVPQISGTKTDHRAAKVKVDNSSNTFNVDGGHRYIPMY